MFRDLDSLNALVSRASPPRSLLLALGLALAGCDELMEEMSQESAQRAVPAGPRPNAAPWPIASYEGCYRECFNADTNATNRETCKLECDGLAEQSLEDRANPAEKAMFHRLRGCLLACWEDASLSATNRETCLLTCSDNAAVAVTPPSRNTAAPTLLRSNPGRE